MKIWRYVRLAERTFSNVVNLHSNAMVELARAQWRALRVDWSSMPLISVVVPLYNDAEHAIEALESIRTQSYRNLECIIVDDTSTDQSPALVETWIKRDTRFRMIHHETNRGLPGSRNTGLAAAVGAYICFLDSDDALSVHSLMRRMLYVDKWKDDAAVMGIFGHVARVNLRIRRIERITAAILGHGAKAMNFVSSQGQCLFACSAPLLKIEPMRRLGGFDESLREGGEDWEFWQRAMRHGFRIEPCRSIVAFYRQKPGSMVRRMSAAHFATACRLMERAYTEIPLNRRQDWPGHMEHPLPYYEFKLRMAERALNFAALAEIAGDGEGRDKILDFFDPGSHSYLAQCVDIKAAIRAGVNRALCRSAKTELPTGSDAARAFEAVYKAYLARTTGA
jgi:glycosyltransferase involved in cell wall biosynthesis